MLPSKSDKGYVHTIPDWFSVRIGNRSDTMWTVLGEIELDRNGPIRSWAVHTVLERYARYLFWFGKRSLDPGSRLKFKKMYGVPSTTKFMLSNFVVEHAIVIFEHAIMIFKHAIVQIEHAIMIFKRAIVQIKYEIRNGMLILLFNMKPLMGLFIMQPWLSIWRTLYICDVQFWIAPCNHNMPCAVTLFYYGRHSSKIIPLPWPVVRQCINIKWIISFLWPVI